MAPLYRQGIRGLEKFSPSRVGVHSQLWTILLFCLFPGILKVESLAVLHSVIHPLTTAGIHSMISQDLSELWGAPRDPVLPILEPRLLMTAPT